MEDPTADEAEKEESRGFYGEKIKKIMSELSIKTTLTDIEPKLDKNGNPYYKLSLTGSPHYFYAFATDYNLKDSTLKALKETPEELVNRSVRLIYSEVANKDNSGKFFK
ncbi:10192_t:CDS:2, partial [Funneliformis geosporum]